MSSGAFSFWSNDGHGRSAEQLASVSIDDAGGVVVEIMERAPRWKPSTARRFARLVLALVGDEPDPGERP